MNSIKIKHNHSFEHQEACLKADDMLQDLANKYGLEIESDGEGNISFSGSGINGSVEINPEEILLFAKLGFLMTAMKPIIESEIKTKLEEKF